MHYSSAKNARKCTTMVQRQEFGSKIATQACVIKEEVLGPLVWEIANKFAFVLAYS